MVAASISLRDVGRTFGATRALAGVDLDLKPGVTGLLGPNGAGKTTLLRLLATALPPGRRRARRAVPRRRVLAAARRVTGARARSGGGVMTATLEFGRPEAAVGRAAFAALAARELRRFVLNPVFLFAVAFIVFALWAGPDAGTTEIDTANPYPAIFLGGFGMMATYWLTRSMRASRSSVSPRSPGRAAPPPCARSR